MNLSHRTRLFTTEKKLMMKYSGLFMLLFLLGMTFQSTAQRRHLNFDEGWKFHLGHAADPSKDFNYSLHTIFSKSGGAYGTAIDPRYNDSEWRALDLHTT